jgi:hypothetical protein
VISKCMLCDFAYIISLKHTTKLVAIVTTLHYARTYFYFISLNIHHKVLYILFFRFLSNNSINQLIFVTVKCCVFFAVRTKYLNIV